MVGGNPLQINVVELRRSVGNQRQVSEVVGLEDVALSSARLVPGSDVMVGLLLEAVSGGVSAAGTVDAAWNGECRRCLDTVSGDLHVDVSEVYEDRPTEGETYPIEGDNIDLEPMLRELAILALPINPLCREDCPGPVPEVFPVVVESDDDEGPAIDPRWAALDALRDDL